MRTPDVNEYRRLQELGTTLSFNQYAHEKLNSTPKSYSEYTYGGISPEYRSYGGVTAVSRPDGSYFSRDSGNTQTNTVWEEDRRAADAPKLQAERYSTEDDRSVPNIQALCAGGYGDEISDKYLAVAREKYNSDTVNIYFSPYPISNTEKFNIRFYDTDTHTNISIPNSLSIRSIYDMMAIVETITESDHYSEELYGTKEHMVAQWIAHNAAHDIATNEFTPDFIIDLSPVLQTLRQAHRSLTLGKMET